jgi:cytoskeleton protein RodZ
MSTEKIEPTVNPTSGLPGALLRQAREDKGLTIEEMSAISNLTKQVIRGIESDEYADLAGLSFVRGYLKLYSKKLGVDETEVLESFDRWKAEQTGGPRQAQTSNSRTQKPSTGPSRVSLVVAVVALAGLVVAGAVISYLESGEDELAVTVDNEPLINEETAELESGTGETVGQEEKILVSVTADAPTIMGGYSATPSAENETQDIEVTQPEEIQPEETLTEIASEATEPEIVRPEQEPTVSATEQPEAELKTEPQESPTKAERPKVVERPEPVVEQAREAEKPVVVSSSNVVSSSVSPEIPAEPVQVPQNLSQGGRVIAEATGLAPPDDGLRPMPQTATSPSADQLGMGARGRLEIEFSGDSWVEIRDALGRLVLADLMTPDKGVDLETYGPVEVLIGAVSVSDVTFNGERQDLEKRAFQDVARVTLGAATN